MTYGACEYCAGRVVERLCTEDRRIHGRLVVFKNVPVGVCSKCGEKYYAGPVLEAMERVAARKPARTRRLSVPEYEFVASE